VRLGIHTKRRQTELNGLPGLLEVPARHPQHVQGCAELHARIEVHDNGWDLSVELDLTDCGAVICFCPCE
jgi:hypothetical protein